jgi:hypothetical protein
MPFHVFAGWGTEGIEDTPKLRTGWMQSTKLRTGVVAVPGKGIESKTDAKRQNSVIQR